MRISIHKFGPIENSVVEFAPMLVFTGDSNLGKSYVNYLMYFVVSSLTENEEMHRFVAQQRKNSPEFEVSIQSVEKWLESRAEQFMRSFLNAPELQCLVSFELLPSDLNKIFKIKITDLGISDGMDKDLELSDSSTKLIQYSIEIDDIVRTFPVPFKYSEDIRDLLITRYFVNRIQNSVFGRQFDTALILPPARGAFVGENYTMKDKISSSVGMYRMFLNDYDRATQPFSFMSGTQSRVDNRYSSEIERLINGKLTFREGKQYMVLKDGRELPLSAVASSIKELSPFLFTLQMEPSSKKSFCIEEPEAHLHPQMQINVTDLIARCFSDGMMFQMTTHSDYVIQRINQLIQLNYIKKKSKTKFKSICAKYNLSDNHCIALENVKMYYFLMNVDGKVMIEPVKLTERGAPMATFFDVVRSTMEMEDVLSNAIDSISDGTNDEDK